MRILITGGHGFIGRQLAELMASRGYAVSILSRQPSTGGGADRITAVQLDRASLPAIIQDVKPDVCFHLAWYTEPRSCLHSDANLDCLSFSLDLFNAVLGAGCKRIVYAGTSVEYKPSAKPVDEMAAVDPQTLYAAAKLSAGTIGLQMASNQEAVFTNARIFSVYGPGEDERRLVPYVIRSLIDNSRCQLTPGLQIRDYLHVRDVATALSCISEEDVHGVVNVGSGLPVSVRDIAMQTARLMNREDLLEFGARDKPSEEPDVLCAVNDRLKGTGWTQRYNLIDGLQDTIDWWTNQVLVNNDT